MNQATPLWGLLPFFFGAQSAYSVVRAYQITAQQDDWMPTTAVVTDVWVYRPEDSSECRFAYLYTVGSSQFRSSLYAADGRACVGQRKLSSGDSIVAYYNPENPKLAVVEKLPPS